METRLDESGIAGIGPDEDESTVSNIDGANEEVMVATARAAISWTGDRFGGRVCVLASMQDTVLSDLVMSVDRSIPIVFLDTGYSFPETLATVRRVEARYGIEVEVVGPIGQPRPDVAPGECCESKVELLGRALEGRDAWISGLRRNETENRGRAPLIGVDRRGKVKISPLVQWNDDDVRLYEQAQRLITHPLVAKGYTSIGCRTCTVRPTGSDPRSGRWAGTERTECGLHL